MFDGVSWLATLAWPLLQVVQLQPVLRYRVAQQVVRESELYTANIYCTVQCTVPVEPLTCFIIMNALTWSVLAAQWVRWGGPRARNLLIIRLNRLHILDTCVSPLARPWSGCPTQTRILRDWAESHHNGFFPATPGWPLLSPCKSWAAERSQAYNLMVGFHKHKPGNQPAVTSLEIPKQHLQIPD